MVSVGNILSPEEGAICLDYLMGAYKHNVSSTALLISK